MATEAATPTFVRGIGQKPLMKKDTKSNEPILDEEGNIIPAKKDSGTKYCHPSPIPRLASAAALKPKDKIPTAGGYAISLSKEPTVDFPPACVMYDEDRPWVLGKLNKAALGVPEPAEPVPIDMERLEKILAGLDVDVPKAVASGKKVVKDDPKAKVSEGGDKPIEDAVAETIAKVFKNTKRSTSRNSSKSPSARKSTPSSPRIQSSNNRSRTPTPKSPRGGDAPAAVAAASEKLASSPRAPKKVVDAK